MANWAMYRVWNGRSVHREDEGELFEMRDYFGYWGEEELRSPMNVGETSETSFEMNESGLHVDWRGDDGQTAFPKSQPLGHSKQTNAETLDMTKRFDTPMRVETRVQKTCHMTRHLSNAAQSTFEDELADMTTPPARFLAIAKQAQSPSQHAESSFKAAQRAFDVDLSSIPAPPLRFIVEASIETARRKAVQTPTCYQPSF